MRSYVFITALMNIGLDARTIFTPEITGVGKYVLKLYQGLRERGHRVVLFTNTDSHQPNSVDSGSTTIAVATSLNRYTWEQVALPGLLRRYPVDLYHATWNFGIPLRYRGKTITTIHDVIPLMLPETYRGGSLMQRVQHFLNTYFEHRTIDRSNQLITVSNTSRRDIVSRFPKAEGKIVVTYEGCDEFLEVHDDVSVLDLQKTFGIIGEYIVYAGGFEKRKNVERLLQIYHDHGASYNVQLVLIGKKNEYFSRYLARYKQQGVVFTDYVPDTMLRALLRNATTMVYPSLYEGFGLPVVEAMAAGIPVVASDIPSLREVGGDAAVFFNPHDSDALHRALSIMLTNAELRGQFHRRGRARAQQFRWRRMVEETERVYHSVLQS